MHNIWYNLHEFNIQANNKILQHPLIYAWLKI